MPRLCGSGKILLEVFSAPHRIACQSCSQPLRSQLISPTHVDNVFGFNSHHIICPERLIRQLRHIVVSNCWQGLITILTWVVMTPLSCFCITSLTSDLRSSPSSMLQRSLCRYHLSFQRFKARMGIQDLQVKKYLDQSRGRMSFALISKFLSASTG